MDLLNKNNKRVLIVLPHKDFRDEEYFLTRKAVESSGINVVTASSDMSPALGVRGSEVNVDALFSDVSPYDYDAIAVIGGRGVRFYLDNAELHKLLKDFFNAGKVVGAICAAPAILAKAGLLSGKKATVWNAPGNEEYAELLKKSGALFSKEDLIVDNGIVTACMPESAARFGSMIASLVRHED